MSSTRNHGTEEIVTTATGARGSACLDYTGIPRSALDALAERQMLGAAKHGRDNYRQGLGDPAYVRSRLSHIIRHAMDLAAKLDGRLEWNGDDDIGAILWGGMFLAEARAMHPELFAVAVAEEASEAEAEAVEQQPVYWRTAQQVMREVETGAKRQRARHWVQLRQGGCVVSLPSLVGDGGPELIATPTAKVATPIVGAIYLHRVTGLRLEVLAVEEEANAALLREVDSSIAPTVRLPIDLFSEAYEIAPGWDGITPGAVFQWGDAFDQVFFYATVVNVDRRRGDVTYKWRSQSGGVAGETKCDIDNFLRDYRRTP